ncbi:MAG: putative signal transducing protein [Thermomicrobiales bacterium]
MPFRFKKSHDAQHPEGKIVPVATAENQMAADMLIGILKMHDISCMARAGGMGIAYLGAALQPHDILVLDHDKERAEEILRAFSDDEEITLLWR